MRTGEEIERVGRVQEIGDTWIERIEGGSGSRISCSKFSTVSSYDVTRSPRSDRRFMFVLFNGRVCLWKFHNHARIRNGANYQRRMESVETY